MHTKPNVFISFLTLSEAEDTDFRQGFTFYLFSGTNFTYQTWRSRQGFTFYLFSGTNFTYQTWRSHTGPAEALKHGAVSRERNLLKF